LKVYTYLFNVITFRLEYAIQVGTNTEILRITSGLVKFKVRPLSPGDSHFGKTSCSPFFKPAFNGLDNPSISGYPDKYTDCCHINSRTGFIPSNTPKLPPPPAQIKCSKTTGLHCSHICVPYQQDKPFSPEPPCIRLDVSSIRPLSSSDPNGNCLLVTIRRDGVNCNPDDFAQKSPKSYALQAVSEDGYPVGGFPKLPTAASGGGKSADYNALEKICTHNHNAKYDEFFDAADTIRTSKTCPKDHLTYTLNVSLVFRS